MTPAKQTKQTVSPTKKSRRAQRLHDTRLAQDREAVQARLLRQSMLREALGSTTPWLPATHWHTDANKVSYQERLEYQSRRALHLIEFPEYDRGWTARFSDVVCRKVWAAVEDAVPGLDWTQLCASFPDPTTLTPLEQVELIAVTRQALTVGLAAVLSAEESGSRFTFHKLCDALGAAFSDHYRAAVEAKRAEHIGDLLPINVTRVGRDLLLNGIQVRGNGKRPGLWKFLVKTLSDAGLYAVERNKSEDGGYHIELAPEHADLFKAIKADPAYHASSQLTLLPVTKPLPPERVRREICGERASSVVEVGERSEKLMTSLAKDVQLLLDASAMQASIDDAVADLETFKAALWQNYGIRTDGRDQAKVLAKIRRIAKAPAEPWAEDRKFLAAQYCRAADIVTQFTKAYEEVEDILREKKAVDSVLGGLPLAHLIPIHTGHFKTPNGRFEPTHLWPLRVTAKPLRLEWAEGENEKQAERLGLKASTGLRWDWFKFQSPLDGTPRPLVGVDVSSSLNQILSVFLGVPELSESIKAGEYKPKVAAAAFKYAAPGYLDADSKKLMEMAKNFRLRRVYGSTVARIVKDHAEDIETYGPGFQGETLAEKLAAAGKFDTDASIPGAQETAKFLAACQAIAAVTMARDPFAGLTLTNPFDGAMVRWNPVQSHAHPVRSNGLSITVRAPGVAGKDYAVSANGDYRVDGGALGRLIAPCLVHMMDALFSGIVMEKLLERGVPVVGIHDCWLTADQVLDRGVPRAGVDVLREVIEEAGEPWLRGLGPIYKVFLDAFAPVDGGKPRRQGPLQRQWAEWAKGIHESWQDRVNRHDWPVFTTSDPRK